MDKGVVPPSKHIIDKKSNSADRTQIAKPSPHSPLLQSQKGNAHINIPCLDITKGLCHSTIVKLLVVKGLSQLQADDFLEALQKKQILYSNPSEQAIPIRFPVLVIEGKSYSTGKFIFKAQNEAVVSGSCMINIQYQLARLFEPFAPESSTKKEPLAFSICTEGSHIGLWVHYTTSQDGKCIYNMSLLKTCHALLLGGVIDFLMVIDKVFS